MAQCPHGDHDLQFAENAELNMYHYKNQVVTNTRCCGLAVRAWPVTVYRAEAYTGLATEDDWGNPIKGQARRDAR